MRRVAVALVILSWTFYSEDVLRSPLYSWGKSLSFSTQQTWNLIPHLPLRDWANHSVSWAPLPILKFGGKHTLCHDVVRSRDCLGEVPRVVGSLLHVLWCSRLSPWAQVLHLACWSLQGPAWERASTERSSVSVFIEWMNRFQSYAL